MVSGGRRRRRAGRGASVAPAAGRPLDGGGTQVGPGTVVGLAYALYDADGELVEESAPDEPLTYVHGLGQLWPALEGALEGLVAGQERTIELDEHDAFGAHDPGAVFEVERDEFPAPERVRIGDEFEAEGEGHEALSLRVIDVLPDGGFVVDTNHPLAGQRLRVRARVEHVRPATGDELAEAEAALAAAQGEGERGERDRGPGGGGLLSAEALVRGRRDRGEA
jgi:FKBP-type peptidyl-prolyl cis-trans isomerase SlyD